MWFSFVLFFCFNKGKPLFTFSTSFNWIHVFLFVFTVNYWIDLRLASIWFQWNVAHKETYLNHKNVLNKISLAMKRKIGLKEKLNCNIFIWYRCQTLNPSEMNKNLQKKILCFMLVIRIKLNKAEIFYNISFCWILSCFDLVTLPI